MKITITEDHWRRGIACDSEHCAIALALTEAGVVDVSVSGTRIKGTLDGRHFYYRTPADAMNVIWRFDKGLPYVPTTLDLPGLEG